MSQNQTANWWISSPSLLEDDQGGSGPVAPAFLIVGPPQNENPNDSIRPWRDELLALRQAEKQENPSSSSRKIRGNSMLQLVGTEPIPLEI